MAASVSVSARAGEFEELCLVALRDKDDRSPERQVLNAFLGASPEFGAASGGWKGGAGHDADRSHPLFLLAGWGFELLPGGACRVDPGVYSELQSHWRSARARWHVEEDQRRRSVLNSLVSCCVEFVELRGSWRDPGVEIPAAARHAEAVVAKHPVLDQTGGLAGRMAAAVEAGAGSPSVAAAWVRRAHGEWAEGRCLGAAPFWAGLRLAAAAQRDSESVVAWEVGDEALREGVPAAFTEAAVMLMLLVLRMGCARCGERHGEAFGAADSPPSSVRLWSFHELTSDRLLSALLAAVPAPAKRASLPAGTVATREGAARRGNVGGHYDPMDPPPARCCLCCYRA